MQTLYYGTGSYAFFQYAALLYSDVTVMRLWIQFMENRNNYLMLKGDNKLYNGWPRYGVTHFVFHSYFF